MSYRNMFDNILFVSPSANTIKDSPLELIDDSQKFTELNEEVYIFTNGNTSHAIEVIGKLGLKEFFSNIYASI